MTMKDFMNRDWIRANPEALICSTDGSIQYVPKGTTDAAAMQIVQDSAGKIDPVVQERTLEDWRDGIVKTIRTIQSDIKSGKRGIPSADDFLIEVLGLK